jgi:hypothetical protein
LGAQSSVIGSHPIPAEPVGQNVMRRGQASQAANDAGPDDLAHTLKFRLGRQINYAVASEADITLVQSTTAAMQLNPVCGSRSALRAAGL